MRENFSTPSCASAIKVVCVALILVFRFSYRRRRFAAAVSPFPRYLLKGLTSSRPSSIFTTPSCPCLAAQQSGVSPDSLGFSGLTSSRPRSMFTTPSHPFFAANQSGVWPSSPGLLRLTSSHPSSVFTTPSCPFLAAQQSGVWPYSLFKCVNSERNLFYVDNIRQVRGCCQGTLSKEG